MPTYEYVCLSCKRHVEAVQRFSDEPLRDCPHCGGPLRRVFHPVGVVLKGSGFYSTDNRGSKHKAASEPKKESTSESTESKPSTTSSEKKSSDSTSSSKSESGSSSAKKKEK
jgi:putative FmdB family regulatory protein